MLMVGLDVRVDAHAARPEVEQADLIKLLEVVNGLVHGLARDRRHRPARGFVDRVDGGVAITAVQEPEDRLALRRHPQSARPEEVGEFARVLHDNRSLSPLIVDYSWSVMGKVRVAELVLADLAVGVAR